MLDCLALDRTIEIQVYHCEGKVRVGEVVGTVGLLIVVGILICRGFSGFVEAEKPAERFLYAAGG